MAEKTMAEKNLEFTDDDELDRFLYGPADEKIDEDLQSNGNLEKDQTESLVGQPAEGGDGALQRQDNFGNKEQPEKETEVVKDALENEALDTPQDAEEEDSESDIEIVLDTHADKPENQKNVLVNIKPSETPANLATAEGDTSRSKGGVDINPEPLYNGKSLFELEPESLEDKPWRRPGADITDYFNYGFDETTWRAYCAKQRTMRESNGKGQITVSSTFLGLCHTSTPAKVLESGADQLDFSMDMPPMLPPFPPFPVRPMPFRPAEATTNQAEEDGGDANLKGGDAKVPKPFPPDFAGFPLGMVPPGMRPPMAPPFFMNRPDMPPGGFPHGRGGFPPGMLMRGMFRGSMPGSGRPLHGDQQRGRSPVRGNNRSESRGRPPRHSNERRDGDYMGQQPSYRHERGSSPGSDRSGGLRPELHRRESSPRQVGGNPPDGRDRHQDWGRRRRDRWEDVDSETRRGGQHYPGRGSVGPRKRGHEEDRGPRRGGKRRH